MTGSTLCKASPRRNLNSLLAAALAVAGMTLPVSAEEAGVKDVFTPAAPEAVQISGRLGDKLNLCVAHRILAQDVESVVAPYRAKTETGGADWRREYWGKWFTSLALADAYHSTPATRELRDAAAKTLMATAAPDGYNSITAEGV